MLIGTSIGIRQQFGALLNSLKTIVAWC